MSADQWHCQKAVHSFPVGTDKSKQQETDVAEFPPTFDLPARSLGSLSQMPADSFGMETTGQLQACSPDLYMKQGENRGAVTDYFIGRS